MSPPPEGLCPARPWLLLAAPKRGVAPGVSAVMRASSVAGTSARRSRGARSAGQKRLAGPGPSAAHLSRNGAGFAHAAMVGTARPPGP